MRTTIIALINLTSAYLGVEGIAFDDRLQNLRHIAFSSLKMNRYESRKQQF
ncbi:MAG: hypothetical protein JWO53_297 [Chlamydiia bacterium]|nr:hypothetical protein [Chlamydiia bacterium]